MNLSEENGRDRSDAQVDLEALVGTDHIFQVGLTIVDLFTRRFNRKCLCFCFRAGRDSLSLSDAFLLHWGRGLMCLKVYASLFLGTVGDKKDVSGNSLPQTGHVSSGL